MGASKPQSEPEPSFFVPLLYKYEHDWERDAALMAYLKTLPRPPWYRRWWNISRWRIRDARESVALFIAPWLRRDAW